MYLIKEMPIAERPRERLEKYGASSLSTCELIAIILHTGTTSASAIEIAQDIIFDIKEASGLQDKTIAELSRFRGVGKAKAITLLAALELGKRALKDEKQMMIISTPAEVFNLVKDEMAGLKQEVMMAIYLDLKGRLIAKKQIFVGGLNQSLIHPREIFKYAVKYSAYSVILVHNHPSGDPEPSQQDLDVTELICEAGTMMQIKVVDHVIIGKNRFVSINDYIKKKGGK
ncbi:MAG: DNA repair protein RadC [Candidatus Izemoplasmatales bacterium]|jgi:DNA repair protein RadC|nr:DNA repair protein RadC [Candidatus Izemoplasmatales bacterium]MDD3864860.1 DNA repair protein RadC [Candidatus Izemoplasmatales bacterium]